MKTKLYFAFPIVTALISLFLSAYLVYALFWPFKTVDIKTPAKIITPVVKVGNPVTYQIEYEKYTSLPARVSVQLVDHVSTAFTVFDSDELPGKGTRQMTFFVPEFTPPGPYHLRFIVTYRPNEFRQIQHTFESESFEVIK